MLDKGSPQLIMTGQERILAAFRGQPVDRVPFAPNIYQWFYVRRAQGTLPPQLADARHPIDALRVLGADILTRWDTQASTRAVFSAGRLEETYGGDSPSPETRITAYNAYPPGSNECVRRFHTPFGPLTERWSYSESAVADFEAEFMWKDWDDYRRIRYFLEARDYTFDAPHFYAWQDRVGSDGAVMVHLTQSPWKTLHWLAGAERIAYFVADHPQEMDELAAIHERKALALLDSILPDPRTGLFISLDNLDSAFYSPRLYDRFCHSFFAQAAERIHAAGKLFIVHACGHSRALLSRVAADRIDCLEGITPPPVGDVAFGRIREWTAAHPAFTINGGLELHHLVGPTGARARIHAYTENLFRELGDKRGFIYASSCNTPPETPWENLEHFRDAAA
jgi:uroporphyrinogen-III decarboxylase